MIAFPTQGSKIVLEKDGNALVFQLLDELACCEWIREKFWPCLRANYDPPHVFKVHLAQILVQWLEADEPERGIHVSQGVYAPQVVSSVDTNADCQVIRATQSHVIDVLRLLGQDQEPMPTCLQNPHVYRGLNVDRKVPVEKIAHEANADP